MNSLEAEYSFLAPTWRLPTVATPSVFPHTYSSSYLTTAPTAGPDWSVWSGSTYKPRYIPPYVPPTGSRPNYSLSTSYPAAGLIEDHSAHSDPHPYKHGNNHHKTQNHGDDGLNLTISLYPNREQDFHQQHSNHQNYSKQNSTPRELTYSNNTFNNHPTSNQRRRVQIFDGNRQTPSTAFNENFSDRNSRNSIHGHTHSHYTHTPDHHKARSQSRTPASNYRSHSDEKRHTHDGSSTKIHDYLYGLSAPDPGSYTDAFKHHQRRLQEEKLGRKSVVNEYRAFARNGGFGPNFGNPEGHTYADKIDSEKRRKFYSKVVHETNQHKIEEQKRLQQIHGSQKHVPEPIPKSQRAREYAETIEKPQHIRPLVRLRDPNSGNVIIREPPYSQYRRLAS